MWQHLLAAAGKTAADPWAGSIFEGLEAGHRFVVVLTALGCATGVIISLAGIAMSWSSASQRRRIEVDLKREMLDRGMSVDEVVKIVEAAAPPEDGPGRWIASWGKCGK
jgi:hypothetical protein